MRNVIAFLGLCFLCLYTSLANAQNIIVTDGSGHFLEDSGNIKVSQANNATILEIPSTQNGNVTTIIIQNHNNASKIQVNTQPGSVQLPAPQTVAIPNDAELKPLLEKSWQHGFDMKFSIGTDLVLSDYLEGIPLGGAFGMDLGYRWKYAGIYFHFNFGLWPSTYCEELVGFSVSLGAKGIFYIPLTETLEMTFGFGLLNTNLLSFGFPLSVGMNWHIGNTTIGLDFTYQPSIYDYYEFDWLHELRLNFVVGYTF